jgi:hypothetical protein
VDSQALLGGQLRLDVESQVGVGHEDKGATCAVVAQDLRVVMLGSTIG